MPNTRATGDSAIGAAGREALSLARSLTLALRRVEPTSAEAPRDDTPSRPPLEQLLSRVSPSAETGDVTVGVAVSQNDLPAIGALLPPDVNPQELADRVYRLMREELAIARERE